MACDLVAFVALVVALVVAFFAVDVRDLALLDAFPFALVFVGGVVEDEVVLSGPLATVVGVVLDALELLAALAGVAFEGAALAGVAFVLVDFVVVPLEALVLVGAVDDFAVVDLGCETVAGLLLLLLLLLLGTLALLLLVAAGSSFFFR